MERLFQIQEETRARAEETVGMHGDWPCRKGCDDCCRSLAEEPRVSATEWELLRPAIAALGEEVRKRVRAGGRVCGLLDPRTGACLVYAVRPVACRSYGFYADRGKVLGCGRIEALAEERPEILWGNHGALERKLEELGEARGLSEWLGKENP